MKKILTSVAIYLAGVFAAYGNVPCSLPFNLQNTTTADATQVMANYNALVSCLGNAAIAGTNNDITSITGLTTPLPATAGGSQVYLGGTSTGAPNAQIISVTPSNFTLGVGKKIIFVAGFSNTVATTFNVNTSGNVNVQRVTPAGVSGTVGGEIVAGQIIEATYDGTNWQLTTNAFPLPIGMSFDMTGGACPPGSAEAVGTAISRTTYATLFAQIGLLWGSGDGSTTFNIPDLRGRATYSRDLNGSARITVAGGNFDGTLVGGSQDRQNWTLTQAQLPAVAPTFTGTPQTPSSNQSNVEFSNTTAGAVLGSDFFPPVHASRGATTVTFTPAGTISNLGSGNAHPILAGAAIVFKCIKL